MAQEGVRQSRTTNLVLMPNSTRKRLLVVTLLLAVGAVAAVISAPFLSADWIARFWVERELARLRAAGEPLSAAEVPTIATWLKQAGRDRLSRQHLQRIISSPETSERELLRLQAGVRAADVHRSLQSAIGGERMFGIRAFQAAGKSNSARSNRPASPATSWNDFAYFLQAMRRGHESAGVRFRSRSLLCGIFPRTLRKRPGWEEVLVCCRSSQDCCNPTGLSG